MIFFGAFLTVFFLLRLWLAGFGGIHPDEAYYWTWSRHLSFGYFDHPPLVAWLIRAGDFGVKFLVPDAAREAYPAFFAQAGLRFFPYLCSCVILPLVLARCIELTQKRPLGVTQMAALLSAPVFLFGPQIVTPDTPFFLGYALCLLVNLRIIEKRGLEAVPGDATPFQPGLAIAGGFALAFAAYAKHSAVLAALLFVICGTGPFNSIVAGLTALALFVPQLLWYRNTGFGESAGLLFQIRNGLGGLDRVSYKSLGDLVATQLLLWTPLTCWLVLYLTAIDIKRFFLPRKLRRPSGTLFLWAAVPVVFFGLTALHRRPEANWPLAGVLPALVLVISRCYDRRKTLFAVVFSHVIVAIGLLLAVFQPAKVANWVRPWAPGLAAPFEKPSRLREFTDWDRFHTLVSEATRGNSAPVLVHTYQLMSGLLFYDDIAPADERLGERLKIWVSGSRTSNFNLGPRYLPDPELKKHWLVTQGYMSIPSGCQLSQTVLKNLDDDQPFNVLRCGF